jgi:hypothetical protein
LYRCAQGSYITGISADGALNCSSCPDYLVGLNGWYCEPCRGYKQPYWDSSECVCADGTGINADMNCVCGPGREFQDRGCVPCGEDFYDNTSLILTDNWFDQRKACQPCAPGYYANGTGNVMCQACPYGMYRQGSDVGCQFCFLGGMWARDPANASSCEACYTNCSLGFSPTPCPFYAGSIPLYACTPCGGIPQNASRSPVGLALGSACDWQCDAGHYSNGTGCLPCNQTECEPGFVRAECTPLSDSNCETACVNGTKPNENSVWGALCTWHCAPGYTITRLDYVLWVQWECIPVSSMSGYWAWGR